ACALFDPLPALFALIPDFDENWVFNPISRREETDMIFLEFSTFL
ncbi:hypothetical protein LINPERHAP2_LOCUS3270, partial [Linum perenne]